MPIDLEQRLEEFPSCILNKTNQQSTYRLALLLFRDAQHARVQVPFNVVVAAHLVVDLRRPVGHRVLEINDTSKLASVGSLAIHDSRDRLDIQFDKNYM